MSRLSALGGALAVSAALASPKHGALPVVADPAPPALATATPPIDACDAALETASTSSDFEKKEANLLHAAVASAIRSDASCAARVKSWLTVHACTQAHGIVSSAAFGTKEWPAAWTSEIVAHALDRDAAGEASCVEATLPSVEQSVHVDPALAEAITRATKHSDPETRDAGWMLMGTVERRARTNGDAALASSLDARIGRELHRRMMTRSTTRDDVDVLLEAAGNAGCASCVPDVERALAAKEPVTRRIAAGALRFVVEPGATARACKVLRADEDARVRSHAAWSLGWSHGDLEARLGCLREASERDASEAVRTDAARAIEQLNSETTTMEDEGA